MQRLKIYDEPAAKGARCDNSKRVTVSVGDLVPLLADAWETDRTWLRDFAKDEVTLTGDLYEVLLAYQQLRRCDAA